VLVPVQPDRYREVHQLGLRHRQAVLAQSSVSYENALPRRFAHQVIKIGDKELTPLPPPRGGHADEAKKKDAEFKKAVADALKAAGYPPKAKADPQGGQGGRSSPS
jgi:hypothetical protein